MTKLQAITGVVRPPRRRHALHGSGRDVMEALSLHPGIWFEVGRGGLEDRRRLNTAAHALRTGRYRGVEADLVEVTVVTDADTGTVYVYARKVA